MNKIVLSSIIFPQVTFSLQIPNLYYPLSLGTLCVHTSAYASFPCLFQNPLYTLSLLSFMHYLGNNKKFYHFLAGLLPSEPLDISSMPAFSEAPAKWLFCMSRASTAVKQVVHQEY
jgi:hypothetical protein